MASEPVVIPVEVDVSASGLDAMRAKLRDTEALLRGLKDGGRIPTVLQIDTANAKAKIKDLTTEIKALGKAAADKDKAGAQRIKDMFGTSVFDLAAGKLAASFGKGKEETAAIKATLIDAGGGFAKAIGGAALAIGAAGAGLVVAGVKLGIEGTAQKQKNIAILDRLTKGQGEIAESVSKQLAGDTGVDEDKAMERVKSLIQAKFDREDTEIVFKASADIGATLGEGKADAFLAILEKVQHEGVATEKALKGLSGVGLDRSAVIEGLRQTGESAEEATARLKAGKVSATEFAKAASAAAAKDFGGIAGKDLDAVFNRAKIAAGDLFDGMDDGLASVKDLGGIISDALSGEDGAKLKASITEAGNAFLNLAKNITKDDVKGAITGIADAASKMAKAIGDAADYAHELAISWKEVSGANAQEGEDIERQIKLQTDKAQLRYEKEQKAKAAAEEAAKAKGDLGGEAGAVPGAKGDDSAAAKGGNATGKDYVDGLAKGIEENAGKPAAAAAAAMAGTIEAGKATAKIKSPSKVTEEEGKNLEEGRALGIERNAGKPAAAAEDSMRRTLRAGGGASPGASGAAASGGGGAITISIVQNLPPGSNESTKEAARAGVDLARPALLAALREVGRLGGVGAGPSLP